MKNKIYHTGQIYSGITRSRVLKGELYTHRFQKSIYLYLVAKLFHEDLALVGVSRTTEGVLT